MTTLKDINFGINQFCGPAVLSALTGKTTDECAAVISSINGKREIKAVDVKDLIKALERLRFSVEATKFAGGTLYGTLRIIHNLDGLYIILVPKHVIALEIKEGLIFLIDNHSRKPIDAAHSARLMQKVDAVYKVVKKGEPKFISSVIEVEHPFPNRSDIVKRNVYEDEKDNTKEQLGFIRYKDKKEFNIIVHELFRLTTNE